MQTKYKIKMATTNKYKAPQFNGNTKVEEDA